MDFNKDGSIKLDHSLCLVCQFEKGSSHLCDNCQWHRAADWLRQQEQKHKESMETLI